MLKNNPLVSEVIGCAIEVHKVLGPGLLESAYEACLCRELELQNIAFRRQAPLTFEYKGMTIEAISKPRGSRGDEAQIKRKSEPPYVGCYSFERTSPERN